MPTEQKQCQNCQTGFTIEPEDFAFYEKIKVPPPTFCPECRYQRRLTNRNEWNFYRRKCDLCAKDTVSLYNSEYPGPVYCHSCWWGDGWDPYAYARDFDFSQPFFEQFHAFRLKVPHIAMANWHSTNSEYTNQSVSNKNCYMCVSTAYSENCLYGYWLDKTRESVDCYDILQSELLYESLNSINCSRSAYLEDCADTTTSYFLKDCRGCTSCFGCYGLRNKSYCWKNEQLTREEYEKRLSEFVFSRANIQKEKILLVELAMRYPHKSYHGRNTLHSVGDYIHDIKNSFAVFHASEAENLRYCQDTNYSKDSIDCTEAWVELGYENEGVTAQSSIGVTKSVQVLNSFYSELCTNSHDLFGCVGLKKAEYCIFNKQYTKEEYAALLEKIIAHMKETKEWGEFFPATRTLFAYNETVAQDYFPLTKTDVLSKGMRWYERPERGYGITLRPEDIPETIGDTNESILEKVIGCVSQDDPGAKEKNLHCTTAFRILPEELAFYRKMNMPIPAKCPACRRQDRMAMRNPRKLWRVHCHCSGQKSANGIYANASSHVHGLNQCPNEFETSYAPERKEIIYCEECYQAEMA
ncbi:MAG: hypothetical protein HY617_03840 [Candidatus Sungbacteria bacterium]|nr:hypothetical protein [Candidatus Sungbacteria bacterium]